MEATVLRLQSLSLVRIAPAEALTNWRRLTVEDTPEMWSVPIVAMAVAQGNDRTHLVADLRSG